MTERTPLGRVFDAAWMSGDMEMRRICAGILIWGRVHVRDTSKQRFSPETDIWKELEWCGCTIEDRGNGGYTVSVEGAGTSYRASDLVRRGDGD